MKPLEIKAEILRRGWSQKELAESFGCSESQLSQVINGHRINARIRRQLARRLGKQVRVIFNTYHPQPVKRQQRQAA